MGCGSGSSRGTRRQKEVGSQGCAQQSPRMGQDELAGCLLQSDVLLEL